MNIQSRSSHWSSPIDKLMCSCTSPQGSIPSVSPQGGGGEEGRVRLHDWLHSDEPFFLNFYATLLFWHVWQKYLWLSVSNLRKEMKKLKNL